MTPFDDDNRDRTPTPEEFVLIISDPDGDLLRVPADPSKPPFVRPQAPIPDGGSDDAH